MDDTRLLETKLDNLWLEGRKLKENLSKFNRTEQQVAKPGMEPRIFNQREKLGFPNQTTKEGFESKKVVFESHRHGNRTFADTLKYDKDINRTCKASSKEEVNKIFFYNSKESERELFTKACVGVVKKPGLAFGVSKSLLEEGIFSMTSTPLGPNFCLLEDNIERERESWSCSYRMQGSGKTLGLQRLRSGGNLMLSVIVQAGYPFMEFHVS